jgi:hypothetical protein
MIQGEMSSCFYKFLYSFFHCVVESSIQRQKHRIFIQVCRHFDPCFHSIIGMNRNTDGYKYKH